MPQRFHALGHNEENICHRRFRNFCDHRARDGCRHRAMVDFPLENSGAVLALLRLSRDRCSFHSVGLARAARLVRPLRAARIDWIRAKARFELSMLLVRTKTAGQKGAFAHDDYRMSFSSQLATSELVGYGDG